MKRPMSLLSSECLEIAYNIYLDKILFQVHFTGEQTIATI